MIRTTSGVFDPVSGEIKITPASRSLLRLLTQILAEKNTKQQLKPIFLKRERKHLFFFEKPSYLPLTFVKPLRIYETVCETDLASHENKRQVETCFLRS